MYLMDLVLYLIMTRFTDIESGTASTIPIFDAYSSTRSWTLFAKNVSSCATVAPNDTFACLMSASKSDFIAGINATLDGGLYPFVPVLDGPGGISERLSCEATVIGPAGECR
jgi:hypothetical protein